MAAQTKREDLVQFTVRLPRDLAAKFEQAAADDDRSVAAELRQLIRSHVGKRSKQTA